MFSQTIIICCDFSDAASKKAQGSNAPGYDATLFRVFLIFSKPHRHASHHCETSHRDEADLIVAVVVRVTATFIVGRVNPTVGGIVGIEQVVEIQPENSLFHNGLRL